MMISVIIPAYNEEETIELLVMKTIDMLRDNSYDGEIIVVNDGSEDNTGRICDQLSKKYNEAVKIVHNEKNTGKKDAIKNGLNVTKGNIIVTIDADLQYDPFDIPKLLKVLEDNNADVVAGRRVNRKDNFERRFLSYVFNLYNRTLFHIPIHDINSGLKAYKKEIFKVVGLVYSEWFIDVELMAKICEANLKVAEVPISHAYREKGISKVSIPSIIYKTIKNSLLLKWSFLMRK